MNKILVIDDNLDDLTLAQLALSHAGYDVVATGNPSHGLAIALERVTGRKPDPARLNELN